ncbi:hypothetical protein C8R46DRAFT_1136469 [Mycena filopes]|nr:hypothetical protein C8R46DRAFT_1136469 [Mycena filopes]
MRRSAKSARNSGMAFLYIVGGSTSASSSSVLLLRLPPLMLSASEADADAVDVEAVDAVDEAVDVVANARTHSSSRTYRGSGSTRPPLALCTSAVPPPGGGTTRSTCTARGLMWFAFALACGEESARYESSSTVGVACAGASGVSRLNCIEFRSNPAPTRGRRTTRGTASCRCGTRSGPPLRCPPPPWSSSVIIFKLLEPGPVYSGSIAVAEGGQGEDEVEGRIWCGESVWRGRLPPRSIHRLRGAGVEEESVWG